MANYLAMNPPGRDEEDYNAAKVFREAMGWIEWARIRPAAVRARGRLL